MLVTHAYHQPSRVLSSLHGTEMSFAPDLTRERTFFRGRLARPVGFREAMGALHDVVVSDFRYQPKDRTAYMAWLAEQDRQFLEAHAVTEQAVRERLAAIHAELAELGRARREVMGPFYSAQARYFQWLYRRDYDAWFVLDPIITVHPDELFFECFSQDEATYARLGLRYDVFEEVDDLACGTTNVDFSMGLHDELERMRSYRRTRFEIDPTGFEVATDERAAHKEKKIDLPESWVAGLLQVQSAMTLGPTSFEVGAVDLYDIIGFLRRHKARTSPRALRWICEPGERVRAVFEPWNEELRLSPVAVYQGATARTVRTWGRDRLRLLERLLPGCRRARVHLLGDGMPSFYTIETADLAFTLGMSAWTKKDWAGGASYQLGDQAEKTSPTERDRVFAALARARRATLGELAAECRLSADAVRAALSHICQVGRGMYDLVSGAYRHRELFGDPLPWDPATTEAERAAEAIAARRDGVSITQANPVPDRGHRVRATVRESTSWLRHETCSPEAFIGLAGEIIESRCRCTEHAPAKPCRHVLALRIAHLRTRGKK